MTTIEQTHYGVTEMAEIFQSMTGQAITKQAMSARMDTKLFKEICQIEGTRDTRMVRIEEFREYVERWISLQP